MYDVVFCELEWWETSTECLSGAELLARAMAAARDAAIPETLIVKTPDALSYRPIDSEMSLYFTTRVHEGAFPQFTDAVRAAGIRVKEAMVIPAHAESSSVSDIYGVLDGPR